MPFGLANTPATFQSYINSAAVQEYLDILVLSYLNDILISSEREEGHTEHVSIGSREVETFSFIHHVEEICI